MIKIFDAAQVRKIDKFTIESENIPSIELMERASKAFYNQVKKRIHTDTSIFVFAGTGNNGGDALAIARLCKKDGYNVTAYLVRSVGTNLSPDGEINLQRLCAFTTVHSIKQESQIPSIPKDSLIIDGLFGSGMNRKLEGIYKEVVKRINASQSKIYSIDMPSGLFMEDNSENDIESIVKATEVFTFQFPKLSLLLPENADYFDNFEILDIGLSKEVIEKEKTEYFYLEKADITSFIKVRNKFSHKGDFGKVLLIAGSYGKMGAAVLASKACLHTGAGLLTVHAPRCGVDVLQTSIPEAMVEADDNIQFSTHIQTDLDKYTIGIGPGIGKEPETKEMLSQLLEKIFVPIVIDADALNIISENNDLKNKLPENSILTPHPVEFDRLVGRNSKNGYQRLQSARNWANQYKVYIVLKGAFSAIVCPDKKVYFNPTGNPGMSTGGSGDTLTGILTSLLAQKYTPLETCLLGMYLHGLAGDLAAASKTQPYMLPSNLIKKISKAYKTLGVK